jgi:hypothetical protein
MNSAGKKALGALGNVAADKMVRYLTVMHEVGQSAVTAGIFHDRLG